MNYSILTIIGVVSMALAVRNKERPIALSAFHLIFTMAGFGIFTFYLSSLTMVETEIFSWPRFSYLMYAFAGMITVAAVVSNKLLSKKLPKWIPVVYSVFEVIGYGGLWFAVGIYY